MAELVDALDSGSSWGNPVKVQVFLAAASLLPTKSLFADVKLSTGFEKTRYAPQESLS